MKLHLLQKKARTASSKLSEILSHGKRFCRNGERCKIGFGVTTNDQRNLVMKPHTFLGQFCKLLLGWLQSPNGMLGQRQTKDQQSRLQKQQNDSTHEEQAISQQAVMINYRQQVVYHLASMACEQYLCQYSLGPTKRRVGWRIDRSFWSFHRWSHAGSFPELILKFCFLLNCLDCLCMEILTAVVQTLKAFDNALSCRDIWILGVHVFCFACHRCIVSATPTAILQLAKVVLAKAKFSWAALTRSVKIFSCSMNWEVYFFRCSTDWERKFLQAECILWRACCASWISFFALPCCVTAACTCFVSSWPAFTFTSDMSAWTSGGNSSWWRRRAATRDLMCLSSLVSAGCKDATGTCKQVGALGAFIHDVSIWKGGGTASGPNWTCSSACLPFPFPWWCHLLGSICILFGSWPRWLASPRRLDPLWGFPFSRLLPLSIVTPLGRGDIVLCCGRRRNKLRIRT